MGGTPKRMYDFAQYIMKEIGHKLPTGTCLSDISQYSYRYSMYKIGPVLSVSVSIVMLVAIETNNLTMRFTYCYYCLLSTIKFKLKTIN